MTRIPLGPDDDIVAAVRAASVDNVVVVIAPGRDALSGAQAEAAIGPLAIERAPMRINAVRVAADADPADVEAAVAFLEAAPSTTGQLLAVGRPQGPSASTTNR